jgi:hypothetical protein
VEQETVDGSAVYRIVGKPVPGHRPVELAIAPHTKAAAVAPDGSSTPVRKDPHRPGTGTAGSGTP